LAPSLVDGERVGEADAGAGDVWGVHVGGAMVLDDAADFSDNGVVGVPSDGSADAGERLLDAAVADLDRVCDWLTEQEFTALLPAEHRSR
jgi:creatinine amidohydrolase